MTYLEGSTTHFDPAERKRTYIFPNNTRISIEGVSELIVRPSGSHRITTITGRHFIVSSGWVAIELDIDEWII